MTRASALVAVLLGVAASAGHAQSANVTVRAQVGAAMTVTGARALSFGNVTAGVASTIPVNGVTSGRFLVNGPGNTGIRLSFTLPGTLVNGGSTLPIGAWTACRNNNNNSTNGCTAFTPSGAGTTATLHPSGNMNVFVGGTVTPAANQAGGLYTGTVTLTVSYI
ncbi:MAG TPA: DUF4402 domain-containing protein [Gemmatimonadales bacterium]|nr:DUF4402 domain-containing protein [Gemmatimonadales bacterium]